MRFPPKTEPARTPLQRKREGELYGRLVTPLRKLSRGIQGLLRGESTKAPGAVQWTAAEQFWMDQLVNEYLQETMGGRAAMRDEAQYVAAADVAALPEAQWLTYRDGVRVGAGIAGQEEAQIAGQALARNQATFLRARYAKLSERGFGCLLDVLERGGDVEAWIASGYQNGGPGITQLINHGLRTGANPNQVGRWLSRCSRNYERYEMVRLARTETMIALNQAAEDELRAQGHELLADIQYPPNHPSCRCGRTIDPATGVQMPDVAATACEVCQTFLRQAQIALAALKDRVRTGA